MALTDSIAAYEDCFQAFERAAKSKKGIRILFEDKKTANYFRLRMNYARVLQRREAVRMYDRTDPRFGKSEFDKFRLKMSKPRSKPANGGFTSTHSAWSGRLWKLRNSNERRTHP
jgi:hypothetical protein